MTVARVDPWRGTLRLLDHPGGTLVVVPTVRAHGMWTCVVVDSDHPSHPPGGYSISVPHDEIDAAPIVPIARPDRLI